MIRRTDPLVSARALAADLGAPVALGGPATQRAVRGWQSVRGRDHPATTVDLDRLGEAIRRAEGVRDRTRARAAVELAGSINTALAIHPDTLRRAAATLIAAEAALDGPDTRPPTAGWAVVGIAGGGVAAGIAAALFAGPVVGLSIAVVLVAVAAGTYAVLARRSPGRPAEDRRAARDLARRRWEDVAGVGADPHDLERVVRRYDPHHSTIESLLGIHPAVRAAERAVVDQRLAWVRGWRDEVGDLTARATFTTDGVLVGADHRIRARLRADATTLVVADPYGGLDRAAADRLHRELTAVPPGLQLVVVLGVAPGAAPGRDDTDDGTEGDPVATAMFAPGAPGTVLARAVPEKR